MADQITLFGRMIIQGNIETLTGLHVGGSMGAFAIGSVDKPVILNPVNGQPYIPGSSLRGKMRSLTEKYMGLPLRGLGNRIRIHQPNNPDDYFASPVAQMYGVPAEDFTLPTRLVVRDIPMTAESVSRMRRAKTDMPYTELKTEVSIDRITSQANPRQIERVPAGAVFGPMDITLSFYRPEDLELVGTLADGMMLVEDDYLGGNGSRGYGKIAFSDLSITIKGGYKNPTVQVFEFPTLYDFMDSLTEVVAHIDSILFGG